MNGQKVKKKSRLDVLLHRRGLVPSREAARRLVMAGEVLVNGEMAVKPGMLVSDHVEIVIKARPRYVSRGGDKLAAALDEFNIRPEGRICADVGASTGGFTDCLLQAGASKVYAIDVGYGQLAWRLRHDPRVVVMERANARYLGNLPEPVNLACVDASFISLTLLLPVARRWLATEGQMILLVKPQFEAGRHQVRKGGVVRDTSVHREVLRKITTLASGEGLTVAGLIPSPLRGPSGNVEFLLWLIERSVSPQAPGVEDMIESALERSQASHQP